jgi:hypothetical protein
MKTALLDWIYETDNPALWTQRETAEEECRRRDRLTAEVRQALQRLGPLQRQVVEQYYYHGNSLSEIGRALGKSSPRVYSIYQQALRRLRRWLTPLVRTEFGVEPVEPVCCICCSSHRRAIEQILRRKRPDQPYSEVMRLIRRRYGLKIPSPQTIKGHLKYHLP